MKKFHYLLFILFSIYAFNVYGIDKNKKAILLVLQNQCIAWNAGNIEQYMQGYWHHDSLQFVSKKGITYGYTNTLEKYKKSYPTKAEMGQLQFDILQINKISHNNYMVQGKWQLQNVNPIPMGYFTLWFKKISGKWYIVMDHTS